MMAARVDGVVRDLLAILDMLVQAEDWLVKAQVAYDRAREALADAEAALLGRGEAQIDGKNAEIRAAQMREATAAGRRAVREASEELVLARSQVEVRRQELSTHRAIARLLAGEEVE